MGTWYPEFDCTEGKWYILFTRDANAYHSEERVMIRQSYDLAEDTEGERKALEELQQ